MRMIATIGRTIATTTAAVPAAAPAVGRREATIINNKTKREAEERAEAARHGEGEKKNRGGSGLMAVLGCSRQRQGGGEKGSGRQAAGSRCSHRCRRMKKKACAAARPVWRVRAGGAAAACAGGGEGAPSGTAAAVLDAARSSVAGASLTKNGILCQLQKPLATSKAFKTLASWAPFGLALQNGSAPAPHRAPFRNCIAPRSFCDELDAHATSDAVVTPPNAPTNTSNTKPSPPLLLLTLHAARRRRLLLRL